ncbi:MAG: DUF1624 domain-containing protein [Ruminococcaceae bacterium]|nr:DUF1624 domain-containing protein [Oscillospiraceae bacterium]
MKKQRIWELDALRGVCIIGMIFVHLIYDLLMFTDLTLHIPQWFLVVQQYGHLLFVLISGICVTLGSKCVKRGLIVYAAGMLVTLVTVFMDYVLQMGNVRIWFGILHLLGVCMLVYPLFKRLPSWLLALIGIIIISIGRWFMTFTVDVDFLFPLGLRSGRIFTGADFFPIFPGLGSFLLGASIGKSLYRNKNTLFPRVSVQLPVICFFSFIGRHSLEIYLLHQPIITGIVILLFS